MNTCHTPTRRASTPCAAPGRRPLAGGWWALPLALALSACQTLPLPEGRPAPPASPAPTAAVASPPPVGHGQATQPAARPAPAPGASATVAPTALAASGGSAASGPAARSAIPPELLASPDLWGRVRRGFAMPPLEHELVEAHARRFASTGFLAARADRVRLFLPLVVEELEQRQMPLELAMLPLVESALNPQARSPVGATGVWQFMAPTGRRFELRQSRLVDDRKNLREATRAALAYLSTLYAQFGDWHLAMAAYNWGEGNVARAAARQRALGEPVNFNTLAPRMPAETRNYVPQIMALAQIVAQPSAQGARLPELPDDNPLVEVDLARDMDLALLLRWAGLSEKEFLMLNAAVKPPLVLAQATPRLLLPLDAGLRFEKAQAQHKGHTTTWSVHRLDKTQPLQALAARFGVSEQALRQANDIAPGHKPVAGSAMLLPVAAPAGSQVPAALIAQASLQTTPDLVQVHTRTRAGDTLATLAQRHHVAVAQLAEWNGMPASPKRKFKAGQRLTLWVLRERAASFAGVGVASVTTAKTKAMRPGPVAFKLPSPTALTDHKVRAMIGAKGKG